MKRAWIYLMIILHRFSYIKSRLEEKGLLEQVGGISYLSHLAASVPTSAHIKQYAKIVESKSILRRLIKACQDISAISYEAKEDVNVILNQAEHNIFHILQNKHTEDFSPMREVLLNAFDKIEEIYRNRGKVTGVPTGFIDLDYKTAGFQPSDFILIAARPSMGKTAFALNIAQYAAVRQKVPVAVFSLEMSKEQLVNRMLCAEAMVDSQSLGLVH